MNSKKTRGFILIVVATFLSMVEGDVLQETNCKDEVGNLCSPSPDAHDQEMADWSQRGVEIAIGISVPTIVLIAVIICVCLFCSFCPLYKHRHNNEGTIYGTDGRQTQNVVFHAQTPQTPQHISQTQYNGYMVSHGGPERPPPYQQNSPANQNMTITFGSK